MTLKDFISLIRDEELRIELELDLEKKDDYVYISFWLSDFRRAIKFGKTHYFDYAQWTVENISFITVMDNRAEILIQIKP